MLPPSTRWVPLLKRRSWRGLPISVRLPPAAVEGATRDLQRPSPAPRLYEAARVLHDAGVTAREGGRLLERRHAGLEGQIELDPPLVRGAGNPELAEALDHADAQRPDAGVHAI